MNAGSPSSLRAPRRACRHVGALLPSERVDVPDGFCHENESTSPDAFATISASTGQFMALAAWALE